jgi:putative oxidoreductase
MNIALWIVQGLLAVMYLIAGVLKTFMTAKAQEQMPWAKRHPENFVRFVGAAELLGGLGLVLPILTGILPWLTPLAALGLVVVQVLAIFMEHVPAKEYKALPMNVVLLALAAFVAYGRFFVIPR